MLQRPFLRLGLSLGLLPAILSISLLFPAIAVAAPEFTFSGGGWGHGIGMSQYGARGYALTGWKYDRILTHYYQGTSVVTKPTQTVRVDLDKNKSARTAWQIQAGSTTRLTVGQCSDADIYYTLDATNPYWITVSGGNTQLRKDASGKPGTLIATFTGDCYATAGGYVRMLSTSGPFAYSKIKWRGRIHFHPASDTTCRAINYVPLEEYLYGVVPRESPSSWPAEALKAQAVAARSYAYDDAVNNRILYCTTMSQVYGGHSRPGYEHEAESTNSAVDATAGKVVWYGSETKPVKTYFMSSSGGHTANIENVWIGSTPKPYYKGVVDADQASSDYSWKVGPLSAATVASRIREKDDGASDTDALDYSVAAPATVTNIKGEYAADGYMHHATVTWSNGKTFRIMGDTLRSAIGLKSTHVRVAVSGTTVTGTTSYEQTNGALAWRGKWDTGASTKMSSGSHFSSDAKGSALYVSFKGTGVSWYGTTSDRYGKAKVYIDGKYTATADLYSASPGFRKKLFSASGLTDANHQLKIVVDGTRNTASTGNRIAVDYISVTDGTLLQATPPTNRYQDTSSRMGFQKTWTKVTASAYSGGSVRRTSQKGAKLYVTFYGSEFRWIGTVAPTYGLAKVTIDGGAPTTVSITSSTISYRKVIFRKSGLSRDRAHTAVIEVLGSGGTKGLVSVDAIDVVGGWLLTPALPTASAQQTSSSIKWSGTWKTTSSTAFSGGSHRVTSTKGSSYTLAFQGTGITLIDRKGPNYGRATIYLDGVNKGTIDQYASRTTDGATIWRISGLSSKVHTVKVVALRTKRSESTGYAVGLDKVIATGRLTAP